MTRACMRFTLVLIIATSAFAIPTQINYQGQLSTPAGAPLDTTVAIMFTVYDALSGGTPHWSETHAAVAVANGLFHVRLGSVLPLADVFTADRWLGIAVGTDTEMIPRQQLVSVAHAYRVGTVDGASGGTIAGKLNAGGGNSNPGDWSIVFGENNTASGVRSVVGGGAQNIASGPVSAVAGGGSNSASGLYATLGAGLFNIASGDYGTVSGGLRNRARGTYSFVGGGGGPDVADSNSAIGTRSVIGGGYRNRVTGGHGVVGGGGNNGALGNYSAVKGGYFNVAGGEAAAIGGGGGNSASGSHAVISGGLNNQATATYANVGGGFTNVASGLTAVVAGGDANTASGYATMVPGGYGNNAAGTYSFAAGRLASAPHPGCFVWADGSGFGVTAPVANRFHVLATGGVAFLSSGNPQNGVYLAPGSGSWSGFCDVNKKNLHGEVNTAEVLERLAHIPLHRWSYKTQDESVQHIGPTAQDFFAAFQLGESDTMINMLDPDGVLLAAVQELAKRTQQVGELQSQVARLQTHVDTLVAGRRQSPADQNEER